MDGDTHVERPSTLPRRERRNGGRLVSTRKASIRAGTSVETPRARTARLPSTRTAILRASLIDRLQQDPCRRLCGCGVLRGRGDVRPCGSARRTTISRSAPALDPRAGSRRAARPSGRIFPATCTTMPCRARSSGSRATRNAVILAHNYERAEVQDVADFVGDSLGLSREAAKTERRRHRLLRRALHGRDGGDSVAARRRCCFPTSPPAARSPSTIDADALRRMEGRASGRRRRLVRQHDRRGEGRERLLLHVGQRGRGRELDSRRQEILFLPDMFLGAHVRRLTGRENIHVWMGECHVHAGIDPENIRLQRSLHPEAEFLIHPECGCSTSVLEAMSAGDVDPEGVQILSTEGMIKRPALSGADEFIVATEVGILHRLRRENPSKRFFAANERASCAYMKVTTLPKVRDALRSHAASHHGAAGRRRAGAPGDRADGRDRRRREAALVSGAERSRSRGIATGGGAPMETARASQRERRRRRRARSRRCPCRR